MAEVSLSNVKKDFGAISIIKGRLVMLDFMGLRGVKFFWRGLMIGWLLLVSALIAIAYWIATK